MSIELKQAAEKALVVLVSATSFMSRKARDQHESVVAELRTAIQQAEAQQPDNAACKSVQKRLEAQQPATGEPVACATPDGLKSNWHAHHVIVNKAALQMVRNALRNDVERGLKVRGEMLAELDSATFQAHPAPSVPGDVVRDAERYRFIRDADVSDDLIPDIALYAMESLDEYIDAAMLAAK